MVVVEASEALELSRLRALTSSGAARSIRVAAGLSLPEVARVAGVGQSTIFRWERGQRRPRASASALAYGRLLTELLIETRHG
jgi:DNA-binding transcriptional regulator YiaG